jgi:dihydroorotase
MIDERSTIIQGDYVTPAGDLEHGQIKVVDGIIAQVGKDIGIADIVYPDDLWIMPGFIDIHVHARDFPLHENVSAGLRAAHAAQIAKETYRTACRAAINGGVVAFADMPNNPPGAAPVNRDLYDAKMTYARRECSLDVVVYALAEAGFSYFGNLPYKIYTHDMGSEQVVDVFRSIRSASLHPLGDRSAPLLTAHCENKEVIENHPERPEEAEIRDIDLILDCSAAYEIPVHIAHVSTAKGLDKIVAAKRSGVHVTCETTPTYVFFNRGRSSMFSMRDYLFMKPPLRTEDDRQRLLDGMRRGQIDVFATDHAPHTLNDKDAGAFGLPLLDHYTNMVGWLMQQDVPLKDIIKACCEAPGRFMERYTGRKFGRIERGCVGSFTVVGKKHPYDMISEPLETKCGWSPFKGALLGDRYLLYAHETIVRGGPVKRRYGGVDG